MTPRVKICGITRTEDAALAVMLGADALGFVFWTRSPRAVTVERARAIAASVPALVSRVGVFVDASPEDVRSTVDAVGLDVAQLHGNEPIEAYADLPVRLIKAVGGDADDERVADVLRRCGPEVTILIDAIDPERRGGTGRTTNWARAARIAAERPIILAGGLSESNVEEAVARVQPWAVDVSSGVEAAPGIKDADRLRRFFAAVARTRTEVS